MLLHILLSKEDRERLGAPDPLVYDSSVWRVSEATALFKVAGMTRADMHKALQSSDPEGRKALTWVALRRAGVEARYSDLDFDLLAWDLEDPSEGPDETAEQPGDEGNSGALPSEGPTPQP